MWTKIGINGRNVHRMCTGLKIVEFSMLQCHFQYCTDVVCIYADTHTA